MQSIKNLFVFTLLASMALAAPHNKRQGNQVTAGSITDLVCTDENAGLGFRDTNVAILGICGGIAGAIEQCQGNPTSSESVSGGAKFTLTPLVSGATLNVSKGRWERCVRTAQAECAEGSALTATCIGGVSEGEGFTFTLEANN